ncbi:MAG: 50S ribosomal protein L17 [Mycoplasma sp.]|nr:50S ribosomal protein L17 [Mycoplasma sp.]
MRSLTTEVIVHGKIKTTITKAKELRRHVEKMITLAKKNTLASRRKAAAWLRDVPSKKDGKDALQYLFEVLGPKYKDRNGGYTRIVKLAPRRGDAATEAIIALV